MKHLNNIILAGVVLAAIATNLVDPPPAKPARPALHRIELEMVARTLLGECAKCGDTEIRWIAHVIYNRLDSGRYGTDIVDVVTFQRDGVYQFSTWDKRLNKRTIVAPGVENTRAFRRMVRLADLAWKEVDDPTCGAINFWHPASMVPRGRTPWWAKGRPTLRIGGALFLSGECHASAAQRRSHLDNHRPNIRMPDHRRLVQRQGEMALPLRLRQRMSHRYGAIA